MLYRNDLLQDKVTGNIYTYMFYELVSEMHCLIDCNGNTVMVTNTDLDDLYNKIEYYMPTGY